MKKLLLSLGTIVAVVAPVASVIACGSSPKTEVKASTTTKVRNRIKSNSQITKEKEVVEVEVAKKRSY